MAGAGAFAAGDGAAGAGAGGSAGVWAGGVVAAGGWAGGVVAAGGCAAGAGAFSSREHAPTASPAAKSAQARGAAPRSLAIRRVPFVAILFPPGLGRARERRRSAAKLMQASHLRFIFDS
jgi:hypothetical protein